MSFDLSIVASTKLSANKLEERFRFSRSGVVAREIEDVPCSFTLPSSWSFLYIQSCDFVERQSMETLSLDSEIYTLALHEGFMASISCSWKHGKKAWEVSHLGSKGIDHLHLEGDLPSAVSIAQKKCADAIASYVPPPPPPNLPVMPESERLMFERMGLKVMPFGAPTPVDFHFDIPIEVFYKVTGFRHNVVSTACDYYHLRKLAKHRKKS